LSDGRITAYDMTKYDCSLCQSFDSSSMHDTLAGRLQPVLCLAVKRGHVYIGDGGVNVKVIDCSQGQISLLCIVRMM